MEKKSLRLCCELILMLTIICFLGTAAYGQAAGGNSKAIIRLYTLMPSGELIQRCCCTRYDGHMD